MVDPATIDFFTNTGFPIGVTVYLLYERSKFNEKVAIALDRVTEALERIETRVR